MIHRGEVWWADLDESRGSSPRYRRPVLIVQTDAFNQSVIRTTIAVVLTSNLSLVEAPGNVLIPKAESGLPKDSVANVSQVITVDREDLRDRTQRLPGRTMSAVEEGLRLALGLPRRPT